MLEYEKKKSEKELINDLIYSIQVKGFMGKKEALSSDDIDRVVVGIIACTKASYEEYDKLASAKGDYEKYTHMQASKLAFRKNLVERYDEDTLYNLVLRLEETSEITKQSITWYSDWIRDALYRGITTKMSFLEKNRTFSGKDSLSKNLYERGLRLAGLSNAGDLLPSEWKECVNEYCDAVYTGCSFNQANNLMNQLSDYCSGYGGYSRDNGRGYWVSNLVFTLRDNYRNRVIEDYFNKKYSVGQKAKK